MSAFFHPSGTGSAGAATATLSVSDRALVSAAATISDGGASATNVYSSSKVESLLDLVEAGISYKEACIAATTAALPACAYTIGPPGVLQGTALAVLPPIGGVSVLVDDRVLVCLQTVEPRQNGIYVVTQLGSASTSWALVRAPDSDGSPVSELRGGNCVTVNEPVPSMRVLTGTGSFMVVDPVLANNDAILWTAYGSATIPTDLYIDTLSLGGGGVNGDLALIRGSDNAVLIQMDGGTGHIDAASITTPGLTAMATFVANINKASVGLGAVDNTADADKPVSTAAAAADAAVLAAAVAADAVVLAAAIAADHYIAPVVWQTSIPLDGGAVIYTTSTGPGVAALLRGVYSPSLGGFMHVNTGYPGTWAVGDRVAIAAEAEQRHNGIYRILNIGGETSGSGWWLERTPDPLIPGATYSVLNLGAPETSIVYGLGLAALTVDDPTLNLNDPIVLATHAASVLPAAINVTSVGTSAGITAGTSLSAGTSLTVGTTSLLSGVVTCSAGVSVAGVLSGPTVDTLRSNVNALSVSPSFTSISTSAAATIGTSIEIKTSANILTSCQVGTTLGVTGATTLTGACTVTGPLTGQTITHIDNSIASLGGGGPIQLPAGTLAAPSVAFAAEANTGLVQEAAASLSAVVGGIARLRVNAGDVRILDSMGVARTVLYDTGDISAASASLGGGAGAGSPAILDAVAATRITMTGATGAIACDTLTVAGATTANASINLLGATSNLLCDGWIVTTAGGRVLCRDVAGLDQIQFDPTGAVTARKNGSLAFVAMVSDERLKTNIVTIDPSTASAELCALRLVKFDYTAVAAAAMGITGRHTGWTGFLAAEYDGVMGTLPEDVVYSSINLPSPVGDPYRTVDTGRAQMCLYAAHKHAIQRLDAQAAQLTAQTALIADLAARLDAAGL
jgi:hypothetical protein